MASADSAVAVIFPRVSNESGRSRYAVEVEDIDRNQTKRVRLTGTRFDGGRLPIDSLVELQKYQDIVRIAAEAEWKAEHPGESVPDDLRDSISLTIERIDEGSADVFLAFEDHQTYVHYQVEAQDAADSIIAAAYSGANIPDLPGLNSVEEFAYRSKVAQLGSTLKTGQTIEYYLDGPKLPPVSISIETREAAAESLLSLEHFMIFADASESSNALKKTDASLVGKVTALDTDKMSYRFTLMDGKQVTGFYKTRPELLIDLRTVVNDAAEGPLTRVSGQLQFKRGDIFRVGRTAAVEQVEFDDTKWGSRLAEFASLRPGWDGGEAKQVESVALDAAQVILRDLDRAGVSRPGVFPTPEGGVLLEWGNSLSVLSVEILEDGGFETFSLVADQSEAKHGAGKNLKDAVEFIVAVIA